MGCDIHSVAQVKKDGKWHTAGGDVAGDHRSYDTFAVLANVRNGRGFAGCDTGDGFIPISQAKGLPDDFEVDDSDYHPSFNPEPSDPDEPRGHWMGDHSHSHLTLAEIQKYVKKVSKMNTVKRGFVSEQEYLTLREEGKSPDCYSGGVGGPKIVTMTAKQYLELESEDKLPKDKEIYVQMQWSEGYLDTGYVPKIVEELEALADANGVGPEDVRMVFGFDS